MRDEEGRWLELTVEIPFYRRGRTGESLDGGELFKR